MGIPLCLFLLLLFFSNCQQTENTSIQLTASTVDQTALKKEVGKVTDLYFKFYKELDVKALNNLLTDDCITMGSDPSEMWDKTTLIQKIKNLKASPNSKTFTKNLSFDLIDRIIQFSNNGKTATVTDHSKVNFSKLLIKKTTILKKVGNDWKINYVNTPLVS